jgi:hypothetical protein
MNCKSNILRGDSNCDNSMTRNFDSRRATVFNNANGKLTDKY